jgi:glucan biosynthesis protein C
MNTQTVNKSAMPQRRWDIDWLRVIAVVLLLVPYHTYRIFDTFETWYVKNDQLSTALNWFIIFGNAFAMQLLFLLAGAATWFALRRRSGGQYAKERLMRLLIPFIFGVLVLVPPQSYFGLRNHSDYAESFLQYYPRFFDFKLEDLGGYYLGGFTLGHLWFIFYLFVLALVALPLFLFLKRESGGRLIHRLATFFTLPGTIFLLAVPIFVMDRLLDFDPDPLYYITFFTYGYILMADARFGEAIDRHKAVALVLGPGVLAFVMGLTGEQPWPAGLPWWIEPIVDIYYDSGFAAWFIILALLGYGRQYLNSPPKRGLSAKFLAYFGEGSYPFYILHQTVIVAIGFYVVQWDALAKLGAGASVLVKYVTIAIASFVTTTILYDLLVRRNNVTRFLFGMRPKKKRPATPAPRPEGTAA